jgi:hypothetical protein
MSFFVVMLVRVGTVSIQRTGWWNPLVECRRLGCAHHVGGVDSPSEHRCSILVGEAHPTLEVEPSTATSSVRPSRWPRETRQAPAGVVVPVFTPSYLSMPSSLLVFFQTIFR